MKADGCFEKSGAEGDQLGGPPNGWPEVLSSWSGGRSRRPGTTEPMTSPWSPAQLVWRRSRFRTHPRPMGNQRVPKPAMMSAALPDGVRSLGTPPPDLAAVVGWIEGQPSARDRLRWTLRDALDSLLDGQHTGRWHYLHLSKTEKTHLGTTIEIMLTREFQIPEGEDLDWRMAGIDVDCKFSKDYGKWEIPREMYLAATIETRSGVADQVAMLVWLDDDRSRWAVGFVRVSDALLSGSANGDDKRKLNERGLESIHWLWGGPQDDLPPNQLNQLADEVRERILGASRLSGQKRVNALLEEFNGRKVHRATVLTVAQQADPMKRPRDSRLPSNLGNKGFLVLGHQDADPLISAMLGLPVATKGEFVPVRVVQVDPADSRLKVRIGDANWAVAGPGDPPVPAPRLPSKQPPEGWANYLGRFDAK